MSWEAAFVPELPKTQPARLHLPVRGRSLAATGDRCGRYLQTVLQSEADKVRSASEGTRNQTLNTAAFCCAQFGDLDDGTIGEELATAARDSGLDDSEIGPTIASGIRAGREKPREIPEPTMPSRKQPTDGGTPIGAPAQAPPIKEGVARLPPLDGWGFWATQFDGLRVAPRDRDWLLRIDGAPCFPRGHVGALIADGGVGKSYLLYQCCIAVVLGRPWLGTFTVHKPGRVALLMGEDDAIEAQSRLFKACNEQGLSTEERDLVCQGVKVFPLHGRDISLVATDSAGNCERTQFTADLFDSLRIEAEQGGFEWALIVMDPLARFGGIDTETNNAAATKFVATAEYFTGLPGNPSVLLSHHASMNSVRSGTPESRGVTGIRNALRWGLTLVAVEADGIRGAILRGNKSNLSPAWRDIALVRNPWRGGDPDEQDRSGTLRLASPLESDLLFAAAELLGRRRGPEPVSRDAYEQRVLKVYQAGPNLPSKSALAKAVTGSRQKVMAAIDRLVASEDLPQRFRGSSAEPSQKP